MAIDFGNHLLTSGTVNPGHVLRYPALIAPTNVDIVGLKQPHARILLILPGMKHDKLCCIFGVSLVVPHTIIR